MTNQVNQFILSSTVHDPEFRLEHQLNEAMPVIKDLFAKQCICYTHPTSDDLIQTLEENGIKTSESKTMERIDTYRQVIKNAKDQITDPPLEYIFYIDLDRIIHWAINFPKELKKIFIDFKGQEFIHIGRSKRAFGTHPPTQRKTERVINKIGSKVAGFSEIRDIISVCFIINKQLAEKLLNINHITTMGFYCTWPLLFYEWAETQDYIEVGGLEWETPDKYQAEIEEIGYDDWLDQFQSHQEWAKRVELMEEGLKELFNLINVEFLPEI